MPERLPLSERIERDFTYHAPTPEQKETYIQIRLAAKLFAATLAEITPECREQSLAITNLEQVVFWANAAVARNP